MSDEEDFLESLANKRFDTEHAINIFASSFFVMPAFSIYDEEVLATQAELIKKCHIYIVGLVPDVDFTGGVQDGNTLRVCFKIHGEEHFAPFELPEGAKLKQEDDGSWHVATLDGRRVWPNMQRAVELIDKQLDFMRFKVLYIGQAFGEDGSRNAIDRLKSHEKLQKISLTAVQKGYHLAVILLEIESGNRMITMFNPWSKESDDDFARIEMGMDKLVETSEAEKTTLYEASLIRYFRPEFNIEFKNSFPSTNMKLLADCYSKDIAAVIAEICIDELPYRLFSEAVPPKDYHIARHDLHKDEDRHVFFSKSRG